MLKDRIEHWYIDEDCNCAESMLHAISEEYGMNFDHMPELHWTLGYPLAIAIMVAGCFGLYGAFKKVGWM